MGRTVVNNLSVNTETCRIAVTETCRTNGSKSHT